MDELTREFLIESQEGLDRMERCLTELETRPGDTALLAEIFRSVHTIKGTTGFLGFKRLEKLAHAGENLLGLLRDAKLAADRPVITGLLQLLDGLRFILKTIEADGSEGDGADCDLIDQLERLQTPEHDKPELVWPDAPEPLANPDELVRPVPPPVAAADLHDIHAAGPPEPGRAIALLFRLPRPKAPCASTSSLLNRMMNLVGELVLTRNQVLQATSADPRMTMLSRRLDMVTADLRESVMKARMQPVSNIFSKMPRMVRDLSQPLGRKVRLEMEGQETELDKSLLEAIKDPLDARGAQRARSRHRAAGSARGGGQESRRHAAAARRPGGQPRHHRGLGRRRRHRRREDAREGDRARADHRRTRRATVASASCCN